MLHAIWNAPTRAEEDPAFELFLDTFDAKYSKATNCLAKDRAELLTFYLFPAEHWGHIRTTNPIESTFATIRLRHRKTKGNGTAQACTAMMFKLAESASKTWRKLRGYRLIPDVIRGAELEHGILKHTQPKAAVV
jgi:transposase-like protein